MISREIMRCRKARRILRSHVSNTPLSLEKFAHYAFKDEKELFPDFLLMYQNKLQEQGVQDAININKITFEPYGHLVDQFFFNLMRLWLSIKIHIVKMKMMKHQGKNIPMRMIQKTHKQNFCNF